MATKFEDHMAKTTPSTWVTKDGRRIAVADMETSHIVFTIQMLERWAYRAEEADINRGLLCMGNPPNGDAALMAWEEEFNRRPGDPRDYLQAHCPPWPALVRELRRRVPFAIEIAAEWYDANWGDAR